MLVMVGGTARQHFILSLHFSLCFPTSTLLGVLLHMEREQSIAEGESSVQIQIIFALLRCRSMREGNQNQTTVIFRIR